MKPLGNLRDEDGGVKPYTDVAEAARRMIDAANNLFITVDVDDDEIDCRCKERLFLLLVSAVQRKVRGEQINEITPSSSPMVSLSSPHM